MLALPRIAMPKMPSRGQVSAWVNKESKALPVLAGIIIMFYMVNLREAHFPQSMQLVAGWSCFAVLVLMYMIPASRKPPWRFLFMIVALYLAMRYMWWRTFETLIYTNVSDFIGMTVLYLAEVYSLVVYFLQLFVNLWPMNRGASPYPSNLADLPTVDVFIPTYSEDVEIVRLTALAATQIDYPKDKLRVYILDDGATLARRNNPALSEAAWKRRYDLKEIARQLGVDYITRETNRAAKAGNINHALSHSSGDLVLFLDCDHVPTSDILRETAGHFLEEEKLFLVQTPHFFCNAAPTERSISGGAPVPDESEMFYRVIHPGLDFWNGSYFCGSAALMRRKHLEEIGGFSGTSITEDAETAFELHRRGYRSRYVNKPMVCGLAAGAYADYVLQHTRWAQGSVQIMLLHNPLFARGLTMAQRICYFNAVLFWFFGIARIIYFIAPAGFLIFGMSIYHASAIQIAAYSLPHVLATYFVSDFLFGKTRRPFFSEIYESIQSVFLTPAVLSVLRHPSKPAFKVTPKGIGLQQDQLSALSFFFFSILVLNAFAASAGLIKFWAQPLYRDVIVVTLIWSLYNILLSIWSVGALWEKRQARQHHRLIVAGTAMVQFPRVRQRLAVDLVDLSLSGLSFSSAFDFEVKDRERVIVEAASTDGLISYFEAEVMRRSDKKGRTLCGAQFLIPAQSLPDVVHYVYGDSGRWAAVWEARSQGLSMPRAMAQLMRMGVRGAWICLTIILRVCWNWIRNHYNSRFLRVEARA